MLNMGIWDYITVGAVGLITGTGGIFLAAKFFSNAILSITLKNFDLKNAKELEQLKAAAGHKTYISKVRFDTEFTIYRDLSATFFDAILQINMIIPQDEETFRRVQSEKRDYKKNNYDLAVSNVKIARDVLHKNAPFIEGKFYEKYNEIVAVMCVQLDNFSHYYEFYYNKNKISEKTSLDKDDMERTALLVDMLSELNDEVRNYLKTLEVIE